MPKLIDYPRTTYTGAWELAEVVDDTGGKCSFEAAARKLDRKVSGSFKAIIGSAVKFGLLLSKREMLTTTTLFKRIKHAYDKQEELLFHREAFLTPPLFTQICRKFRSRELPVQMLDVMLIREFDVEEINAQGVAKAFVEGSQMVGLLDDRNVMADIDALAATKPPRRELASPPAPTNTFRHSGAVADPSMEAQPTTSTNVVPTQPPAAKVAGVDEATGSSHAAHPLEIISTNSSSKLSTNTDAIASLFGLATGNDSAQTSLQSEPTPIVASNDPAGARAAQLAAAPLLAPPRPAPTPVQQANILAKTVLAAPHVAAATASGYQLQVSGPGVNTSLSITDEADIALAMGLLEKIRRQLAN